MQRSANSATELYSSCAAIPASAHVCPSTSGGPPRAARVHRADERARRRCRRAGRRRRRGVRRARGQDHWRASWPRRPDVVGRQGSSQSSSLSSGGIIEWKGNSIGTSRLPSCQRLSALGYRELKAREPRAESRKISPLSAHAPGPRAPPATPERGMPFRPRPAAQRAHRRW
jgi:hypothetical protein